MTDNDLKALNSALKANFIKGLVNLALHVESKVCKF